jgi:hypothetical protein
VAKVPTDDVEKVIGRAGLLAETISIIVEAGSWKSRKQYELETVTGLPGHYPLGETENDRPRRWDWDRV